MDIRQEEENGAAAMNLPIGKIAFIWRLENCAKGNVPAIIAEVKRLGCTVVALKVANGYRPWTGLETFVAACHAAGLQVYGWHYLYAGVVFDKSGNWSNTAITPEQEAAVSAQQVQALGLDGFIIDAEKELKVSTQANRARRYIQALKPRITIPTGLSSYRFPTMHREFPWLEFLAGVDFHCPQVYWNPPAGTSFGPAPELERSCRELTTLAALPIIPIGRAYIGDGHPNPKPQEIADFLAKAGALSLPAAGFWALDFLYLHAGGQERADAIAAFDWGEPPEIVSWGWQVTNVLRKLGYPMTDPPEGI